MTSANEVRPMRDTRGHGTLLAMFFWAMSSGLASAQATDVVIYYHTDAIGSVRAITDANGQELQRFDFLPFGEPMPAPPLTADVRQFAGKERDPETGFNYFGARYYQSHTGRFTRPDDLGFMDPFNPQSMNLYGYALNNPLRFVDPTGHCPEPLPAGYFCAETVGSDPGASERERRAAEAWADSQRFFLDSLFNHLLTPQVVNFSAGLGDALLLGSGPYFRRQLDINVVDQCSTAYSAGGWSSFAFGAARVGYAGLAKSASVLASSGAEASAFRQGLRTAARLGMASGWRQPNLAKYGTDEALRAAAGRTNPFVNAWGAGTAAAGAAGALGCGR